MRPETITLVRHGESCGNADFTTYKVITDDLMDITPKGERQAETAIEPIRRVIGSDRALFYTSPYLRCKRTLAIIRAGFDACQISVIEDNNLRERKIGNLIELNEFHSIRDEANAQGFFFRPPCGESVAEVFSRSETFRAALRSRWECASHPRHVVIVAHNTVLKTFLMGELLISAAHFADLGALENAQAVTLRPTETMFGLQYIPTELPIGITEKHINSTLS